MAAENLLGQVVGGFTLSKVLGEGASSYVLRGARGAEIRAIKVYKPSFFEENAGEETRRLERAMRVAARIKHQNIAAPLEWGFDETGLQRYCYVVMELAEGPSLSSAVQQRAGFDPTTFSAIAMQLIDAIAALHSGNAIHRDIKPENVVLLDNGVAVLVDLGVVRDPDSRSVLTEAGGFLGSRRYAAPEYLFGRDGAADSPSLDLYSLGATFFEMITGKPP